MDNKQQKFENPLRLAELEPENTLKRLGLKEGDILCDVGAGTGIFTIPAARITHETVYALEIDDSMLAIMAEKIKDGGIQNIELLKVHDDCLPIRDQSVDLALMVTVLHEIEHPAEVLKEVKRILKSSGKLAVIEFHKKDTPFGPPLDHRISKEKIKDLLTTAGFRKDEEFDLGENFHCLIFLRN